MSEPKNINDAIKMTEASMLNLSAVERNQKRTDMIIYALRHRTFLIFPKEKRLLACAPEGIIEFGSVEKDRVMASLELIEKTFDRYVKEEGIKDPKRISSIIEVLSEIDSSYIGEFYRDVSSKLESIASKVSEAYKKHDSLAERHVFNDGIKEAFIETKLKVPEDNFKTGSFRINPREEKLNARNEFIANLLRIGIGDFELYNKLGYFKDLSQEDIFALVEAKIIDQNQFRKVLTDKFNIKSAEEYFDYLTRLKKVNKEYLSSFTTEELIGLSLDGKLDKKVFTRMKFAPHYVAALPLGKLLDLVSDTSLSSHVGMTETKNENGKNQVYIKKDFIKSLQGFKLVNILSRTGFKPDMTEEELFDQYLDTLTGTDVINLAKLGFIDEADVIRINFIRTGNPYKDNMMVDEILDFYDFDRLLGMVTDKKITKRFVEDFHDTLDYSDKEQTDRYIDKLIKTHVESIQRDEIMAALSIAGCFDGIDLKGYKIGPKNLEQLYLMDRITESDMIALASNNMISIDTLGEFLTDAEITESIMEGKLPLDAFKATRNGEDTLLELLDKGKISPKELGHIYSTYENMSAETFIDLLEYVDEAGDIDISDLLDDDISKEKVEDLFSKFYISQDELSNLVGRNIITQTEADRYAKELEKHNNFNSLFKQDSPSIKLIKASESRGRVDPTGETEGTTTRKGDKIDFDLKEKLLFEMGASKNVLELIGKRNSLDGYRVYGFEKTGAMVFMSPDPDNATYVMSLAQGLYFIKNFERENSDKSSQVISTATKRALRNTEHIDVRNASKKWGKNMIRSIDRKGSDISPRSKEYKARLDAICREIEDDYISKL